jgi:ribonucleotide monophosphatase NagD (HAD superfamily)
MKRAPLATKKAALCIISQLKERVSPTADFLRRQEGKKAYVVGEGALIHELYKAGFTITDVVKGAGFPDDDKIRVDVGNGKAGFVQLVDQRPFTQD